METIKSIKKEKKEIFKINNVIQPNESNTLDIILDKNRELNNTCEDIRKRCFKLEVKLAKEIEKTTQLYKQNQQLKIDYKEYDNFRMSMSCIDILNKALLFFLIFYMLTSTSYSFTKIIHTGFSFFDWIVFFLCMIQFYCKVPILYGKLIKN